MSEQEKDSNTSRPRTSDAPADSFELTVIGQFIHKMFEITELTPSEKKAFITSSIKGFADVEVTFGEPKEGEIARVVESKQEPVRLVPVEDAQTLKQLSDVQPETVSKDDIKQPINVPRKIEEIKPTPSIQTEEPEEVSPDDLQPANLSHENQHPRWASAPQDPNAPTVPQQQVDPRYLPREESDPTSHIQAGRTYEPEPEEIVEVSKPHFNFKRFSGQLPEPETYTSYMVNSTKQYRGWSAGQLCRILNIKDPRTLGPAARKLKLKHRALVHKQQVLNRNGSKTTLTLYDEIAVRELMAYFKFHTR